MMSNGASLSPARQSRCTSASQPAASVVWRPTEPFTLILLFVIALGLRVVYAFHYRADSDEAQHLHVAWAWTRGLLPYRDLFDNHAPLFALVCAPILNCWGERADIVPLMRLCLFPLYGLMLLCTYALGRRLFGAVTGLRAAV